MTVVHIIRYATGCPRLLPDRHHEELEPDSPIRETSVTKGLPIFYIWPHKLSPIWRPHQVTLILAKAASRYDCLT